MADGGRACTGKEEGQGEEIAREELIIRGLHAYVERVLAPGHPGVEGRGGARGRGGAQREGRRQVLEVAVQLGGLGERGDGLGGALLLCGGEPRREQQAQGEEGGA